MAIYPYSFTLPPVNKQDIPSDGVVGEFLGISAGGVLDWLPVSGGGGGGDMLKSENLSGLADYAIARTNIGLGLTSSPEFANLTLTSPSLASSAPVTISQTWNNAAVGFNALVVNAAGTSGTNSASGSLLLNLQVNGASSFFVRKDGAVYGAGNAVFASSVGVGSFGSNLSFYAGLIGGGRAAVSIGNGWSYAFSSGAQAVSNQDVFLTRDDVGTLALRNGAAAQTFNVYGTWTTAITNFERLAIKYNTTDVAYQIAAEKGTTNGDYRPLQLWTGGASRLHVATDGNVGIGTTTPFSSGAAAKYLTISHAGIPGIYWQNTSAAANSRNWNFLVDGIKFEFQSVNDALTASSIALRFNRNSGLTTIDSVEIPSSRLIVGGTGNTTIAGNVGIGTTNPGAKLDLVVTGNAAAIKVRNTDTPTGNQQAWIDLGFSDSRRFIISAAGDIIGDSKYNGFNYINSLGKPFTIIENNVNVITASSGNVGIGTISPTSKLHVAGDVTLPNGGSIFFGGGFNIYGTTTSTTINGPTAFGILNVASNGVTKWTFNYDGLLCGGGTTAAFPALKRSSTTMQVRLADDTAFAQIQGKLTTDTAFTATTVTPTGFITLYDSTGTAYKVPCVQA